MKAIEKKSNRKISQQRKPLKEKKKIEGSC